MTIGRFCTQDKLYSHGFLRCSIDPHRRVGRREHRKCLSDLKEASLQACFIAKGSKLSQYRTLGMYYGCFISGCLSTREEATLFRCVGMSASHNTHVFSALLIVALTVSICRTTHREVSECLLELTDEAG